MEMHYSEKKLEELVSLTVRAMCIKAAISAAPVYSLREMLSLKTVSVLKHLAKLNNLSRYSSMNKTALVEVLEGALPDGDLLEEVLLLVHDSEWTLFSKSADGGKAPEPRRPDDFLLTQSLGYMQVFYHESKLVSVVPEEIKAVWQKLKKAGFLRRRERIALLHKYAMAAASLYGIIKVDELIDVFNRQNSQKTNEAELFEALDRFVTIGAGYCFWRDWLVDDTFEEENFEAVPELAEQTQSKPRYVPQRDELLKCSDPDYLDITSQAQELYDFMKDELGLDSYDAEDFTDEVLFMARVDQHVSEVFPLLEEYEIVLASMEQANELVSLVVKAQNNARMWANKGYTPMEMRRLSESNIIPFSAQRVRKIGRNEPCPCGSGKKYKRCCGAI